MSFLSCTGAHLYRHRENGVHHAIDTVDQRGIIPNRKFRREYRLSLWRNGVRSKIVAEFGDMGTTLAENWIGGQ